MVIKTGVVLQNVDTKEYVELSPSGYFYGYVDSIFEATVFHPELDGVWASVRDELLAQIPEGKGRDWSTAKLQVIPVKVTRVIEGVE